MTLILVILLIMCFIIALWNANVFWFAFCVTVIILGYDIYFVHIEEMLPKAYTWILKAWQEIILGFAIYKLWKSNIKQSVPIYVLIFLAIDGIAIGILNGNTTLQILKGARMYLVLPFSFYLLSVSGHFKNIQTVNIIIPLLAFTSLSTIYSIIQEFRFDGNLKILWFYDFVNNINPIEIARFNYIRDDHLRASGLFISPLIQSSILGFTCLIITIWFVLGKSSLPSKTLGFLLGLHVYGLFLCRTRIGFILFGIGLLLSYLHFNKSSLNYWMSISVPLVLILITILVLVLGFSNDSSALGRIPQYEFLFSNFRWFGLGFGSPKTLTFFDSMYISSGLVYGIHCLTYIFIPFWACYKLYMERSYYMDFSSLDSIFFAATFGYCFSLLYMFAFQFTLGSPTIQIFYWLIFAFLSRYHISKKSSNT